MRIPAIALLALSTLLAASVLAPFALSAQEDEPAGRAMLQPPAPAAIPTTWHDEEGRLVIRAHRLEEPIRLDGVLDEEVYRRYQPASGFTQQFPRNGEPATDDTHIWLFYDEENLYVGVRAWDSQPERIVANEMRRDAQTLFQNDNLVIAFDTFLDRRSAFYFQTTPLGALRDAIIVDEFTTNYDFKTVWDVRARLDEHGWTAELVIPFKSLRYVPGDEQVWGFNVMRNARSRNELSMLSPVPSTFSRNGIFGVTYAADLVGIEPPPGSRNIELRPYAISTLTTDRPAGISNEWHGDVGVDARVGLTSSFNLDLTYNTDFAQVEIDEQQVNLTRFSVLFPEKRDFFLEGQSVFEFAGSGAFRPNIVDPSPVVFFSRRIGIGETGPVPITGGGRLMGRAGRFSVGALNIHTADTPEAGAPATGFSVVRVKRDIFERSNVGVIATLRDPAGPDAASNRLYGADANLSFYDNVRLDGYYAFSSTPGVTGETDSYRTQFEYAADRYGLVAQRLKVGDAFRPEVGFLRRSDFHRTFGLARFSPRPATGDLVRRYTWEASIDRYVNSRDVLETQQDRGRFGIEFHAGDMAFLNYSRNHEFLARPLPLAQGFAVPPGSYRFHEVTATYMPAVQRLLGGMFTVGHGSFFDGRRTQASYNGRARFSSRFALEPRISLDWVTLPQGSFQVRAVGARPILSFSPRNFVSALVQYNSSTRSVESNLRWRWEYRPGSALYVVYTDGRDTSGLATQELVNRGIAIKVTRFLRF